ncbi:MAG: dihydroorotate dehydrogenase [Clostridia bacterium]|nr:dihydroorotate dehydrogenase [Clostridia bacterium]MBQ4575832.1 dihydroorotate dehydrogenase [Clostridia bacterium]
MAKVDMSVNIAGVTLRNPVVTVSGACGFGEEYKPFYTTADIGAIAVKGTTLLPRLGNAVPRIAETPAGILNSIGLQNPGVDVFVTRELPRLREEGACVIANIAGSTLEDYQAVAERVADAGVDLIEMNISCPNVKEGGVAFGVIPAMVEKITAAVKEKCGKVPLIVKLSPNVADIAENARAAQAGGADALSLINTLIGMRIDIKSRKPILANKIGGLSGPAVFPVAVRMVWQAKKATGLPIIGMGGVATAEDAIEIMMAGADAVGVGTAMFKNPMAPIEIRDGIERWCEEHGIADVKEITGSVID